MNRNFAKIKNKKAKQKAKRNQHQLTATIRVKQASLKNEYLAKGNSKFNPPSVAQKMKFSIKGFFSKCDQIRRKLRIWSHLLKKSLMENFIFCEVQECK